MVVKGVETVIITFISSQLFFGTQKHASLLKIFVSGLLEKVEPYEYSQFFRCRGIRNTGYRAIDINLLSLAKLYNINFGSHVFRRNK